MAEGDDEARLFAAWRKGDEAAGDRLFERLYGDLANIASSLLRRERSDISLATGDLINEAVVRLLGAAALDVTDRAHLLRLSARVMRRVLLDAAQRKARRKRKGANITLRPSQDGAGAANIDLVTLDHALRRLHVIDPVRAEIVTMRYFGGMTIEEIAAALGVSRETVKRSWSAARLWLEEAIRHDIRNE